MIYEQNSFLCGLINDPELAYHIIDSLPFPINYRDGNGKYLSCNKAFERMLGRAREEMIGKGGPDLHNADVLEMITMKDKEISESATDLVYEHSYKSADGAWLDYLIYKSSIRNLDGSLLGIVTSFYDISEKKRSEIRSEKAKESSVIASAMLQKIRAGILIVDHNMKVVSCNESFAQLMGEETEELYEAIPGLPGADVRELVPEIVSKMMNGLLHSGEEMLERDLTFNNKLLHISIVTIFKNRVVGAIIRNLSSPKLVREEIISRAMKVTRQNIEMVQQVATLLAENAAQTEDMLNSIVAAYKYGEDRKDE
ncbi:MAG: PAS domain S-box protein [Marinilabiliales bacterium]|nr:PAS domain S-box protein [Marinilabiliales bacterium]